MVVTAQAGNCGVDGSHSMATSDRLVRSPGELNDLASRIAAKTLSPVDLVQGYLDRISEVDRMVMAWTHVDGERALVEA